MKEIIKSLKNGAGQDQDGPLLTSNDADKIVTAFEQLEAYVNMYKFQFLEIEKALFDKELSDQERNEITAVKIKLQSVITDLSKVLG